MSIEEIQFKGTLQLLIPMVIEQMRNEYGLTSSAALQELYSSQLYILGVLS